MSKTDDTLTFLRNGGETGRLIRSADWSGHVLGAPETWPQTLRMALGIILHSRFPMFLFWGRDLICFYNDAFRPSLGNEGKHPSALGKTGPEVWPEIWDTIKPLIDTVVNKQEAVWFEDALIPIYRNGQMEDVYWTFSYSPLLDEHGSVAGVFVTCVETTDKVSSARAVEEKERKLNNLLMQAPVALLMLKGPDYVVELANDYYQAISRVPIESLKGRPVFSVLNGANDGRFIEILDKVRETGQPSGLHEYRTSLVRNGREEIVYLNIVYQPVKEADGRVDLILVLINEVTEMVDARKQIEEIVERRTHELAAANHTLEKSNRDLEQFAYVASHDLQEPLRKVKAFGDLLKNRFQGVIGKDGADLIDRMQGASQRMHQLIDDLLTFSRVTSAKALFTDVDLNIVLGEVISDLEAPIREKKAVVDLEALHPVSGDAGQMRQLFQNLLSNALKFTREGEMPVINVRSGLVIGKDSGFELNPRMAKKLFQLIEVEDNGIGFEQQYAERIFQIFQRLHGRSTYSGTGIGLSIVEKVMNNHHGFVRAVGEPGRGARFFLLFPFGSK